MNDSREEPYRLVELPNGSHAIYSSEFQETCHPVVGPAREAEIYVRQLRLDEKLAQLGRGRELVVWDVGMGSASNAMAVLGCGRGATARLRLVSFDRSLGQLEFALAQRDKISELEEFRGPIKELVARYECRFSRDSLQIHWQLVLGDFPRLAESGFSEDIPAPDAILWDPHSPARNPAMWTLGLFRKVHGFLDPQQSCTLTTYSRSTQCRVTMLLAGFHVGRGEAIADKEETTLAATRLEDVPQPLDARWLERVQRSTNAEPLTRDAFDKAPITNASWKALLQHPQFAE